jgi:hypothetical protein
VLASRLEEVEKLYHSACGRASSPVPELPRPARRSTWLSGLSARTLIRPTSRIQRSRQWSSLVRLVATYQAEGSPSDSSQETVLHRIHGALPGVCGDIGSYVPGLAWPGSGQNKQDRPRPKAVLCHPKPAEMPSMTSAEFVDCTGSGAALQDSCRLECRDRRAGNPRGRTQIDCRHSLRES